MNGGAAVSGLGHARTPKVWELYARLDGDTFIGMARDWQVARYRTDLPMVRVEVAVNPSGDYWGWLGGAAKLPAYLTPDREELEACLVSNRVSPADGKILQFTVIPARYEGTL